MKFEYKKGYGVHGKGVKLTVSPENSKKALQVRQRLKKIARELYTEGKAGGASDIVVTSQGPDAIYQCSDLNVNLRRAKRTTVVYVQRFGPLEQRKKEKGG